MRNFFLSTNLILFRTIRWPNINWIVSERYDFLFFSGSILGSAIFFFFYQILTSFDLLSGKITLYILYFIFSSLIDVPHLLHTFSRTHLDSVEYKRHQFIHREFLIFILILTFFLTFIFSEYSLFLKLADSYGIWHVMKQNWGFIKIYKKLNHDRDFLDNFMDKFLFYPTTIIYCLLSFQRDWESLLSSIPVMIFFIYICYQLFRLIKKKKINGPKLFFVFNIFSAMAIIQLYLHVPSLLLMILNSTYHGIQYYGWNMHFQKKRLHFSKINISLWNIAAIILGIIITALMISIEKFEIVFTIFILYHYLTDGMIWKFKKQPELNSLLLAKN